MRYLGLYIDYDVLDDRVHDGCREIDKFYLSAWQVPSDACFKKLFKKIAKSACGFESSDQHGLNDVCILMIGSLV